MIGVYNPILRILHRHASYSRIYPTLDPELERPILDKAIHVGDVSFFVSYHMFRTLLDCSDGLYVTSFIRMCSCIGLPKMNPILAAARPPFQ